MKIIKSNIIYLSLYKFSQRCKYICLSVYLSVCLFFIDAKTTEPIFNKFCTHIELCSERNIG